MRIKSGKSSIGKNSSTNGLPSINSKSKLVYTRNLDNHWDTNVHHNPWISPGKQPEYAYNFDDTGLGFKMRAIYDSLLTQKREQIQSMNQEFRNYRELDDIRENDVVVTIEYCTDCASHSFTTRHCEQQYLNMALELKKKILNHYPTIKVYLKPNVVDQQDKSVDGIYIRRRIGAMEIQIAAGNEDGTIKKGVLHTKLQTGCWPLPTKVINDIRPFMLRTSLTIILDLQAFDLSEVKPEDLRNKKVNKLYDIQVTLRPYREKKEIPQQQQQTNKSIHQINEVNQVEQILNRPLSGLSHISRPKSALSNANISHGSMRSLNEQTSQHQGNTTGRLDKSVEKKKKPVQQVGVLKLKTDIDGTVEFKDIPYDVYIFEIKENNEFKALRKKIDIFQKIEMEELMEEKFTLMHLNRTFLKISCEQIVEDGDNVRYGYIKNAKISINPIIKNTKDEDNEITDTFSGTYDVTLVPGEFYIEIEKKNWITTRQTIICRPGSQEVQLPPMRQAIHEEDHNQVSGKAQRKQLLLKNGQGKGQSPTKTNESDQQQPQTQKRPTSASKRPISAKTLTIYVYDGSDNTPIKDVKISIIEKKLPRQTESLYTDENGVCKIILQNILEGIMEISHKDFITISEEYAPNKMDLNKMKDMAFPLMQKPQNADEVHIRVLTNIGKRVMTLHVITPNDQLVSESNEDIEIDNKLEEGQGFLKIKNIKSNQGVYRIYSRLLEPELFNPSYIKVYAICQNEMKFIEVPKSFPINIEKPKYWDIGFVRCNKKDFIEINAPTSTEIRRDFMLSEYQNLLNFLKRSNNKIDQKQILGFNNNEKMDIQDDTLVKVEVILRSLDTYAFEEWKNIQHLLVSAIQLNGLYSFNKLNNKFNSIQAPYDWIENHQKHQKQDEEEEDEQYLDGDY